MEDEEAIDVHAEAPEKSAIDKDFQPQLNMDSTEGSGDSNDDAPLPAQPVKKSRGRPPAAKIPEVALELAFFVPNSCLLLATRVAMLLDISFDNAIARIHATIGCESVLKKPALSYKMEKTGRKPISLQSEDDWDGLKAHMFGLGKKQIIQGYIIVDDAYMEALRNKLTGLTDSSAKTTASGIKGSCSGKKAPIMNLDSLDDGEEAHANVQAQAEAELSEFITLKKILLGCGCPECKDHCCKVNMHGVHVELNALQLSTWSSVLALKTYGGTYDNPLPCKIFDEFHARQAERVPPHCHPCCT
ncbi:hypothetical protein K439DRAFT_1615677 [Ramaria rubella]|nr:hypothetical protein K439DRAFT_1615677 [Ramaria rubella]